MRNDLRSQAVGLPGWLKLSAEIDVDRDGGDAAVVDDQCDRLRQIDVFGRFAYRLSGHRRGVPGDEVRAVHGLATVASLDASDPRRGPHGTR